MRCDAMRCGTEATLTVGLLELHEDLDARVAGVVVLVLALVVDDEALHAAPLAALLLDLVVQRLVHFAGRHHVAQQQRARGAAPHEPLHDEMPRRLARDGQALLLLQRVGRRVQQLLLQRGLLPGRRRVGAGQRSRRDARRRRRRWRRRRDRDAGRHRCRCNTQCGP